MKHKCFRYIVFCILAFQPTFNSLLIEETKFVQDDQIIDLMCENVTEKCTLQNKDRNTAEQNDRFVKKLHTKFKKEYLQALVADDQLITNDQNVFEIQRQSLNIKESPYIKETQFVKKNILEIPGLTYETEMYSKGEENVLDEENNDKPFKIIHTLHPSQKPLCRTINPEQYCTNYCMNVFESSGRCIRHKMVYYCLCKSYDPPGFTTYDPDDTDYPNRGLTLQLAFLNLTVIILHLCYHLSFSMTLR